SNQPSPVDTQYLYSSALPAPCGNRSEVLLADIDSRTPSAFERAIPILSSAISKMNSVRRAEFPQHARCGKCSEARSGSPLVPDLTNDTYRRCCRFCVKFP